MAQVAEDGEMDLNLIPLLDLVLQLMMFFIIVANFAEQEVRSDIKLPFATSATLPDPNETDLLFVNVGWDPYAKKASLLVTGDTPRQTLPEIEYWLSQEAQHARAAQQAKGNNSPVLDTVVVIRAHRDCDFRPIYEVLRICKQVGFKKWQLRAIMHNQPAAGG